MRQDLMVQVRLDIPGKDEAVARQVAKEMGVVISRVKQREDVVQVYGSKLFPMFSCTKV